MGAKAALDDPFELAGVTIEGKYRISEPVGDGGFGVVYRGVHEGFGEPIAVKCLKLPKNLAAPEREELLRQLKEEGRLLHRLSRATPGIVQALDVGAFTSPSGAWLPYLVLEWLDGVTLAELMRDRLEAGEGGMPLAEAVALLEPAARALSVAHAQKVAHRDVKPANLFVTQSLGARTVKVLDFGIAKVFTENATLTAALAATSNAPSAFTPRYGAPEQFNKQRGATGPWTDVFALALILVELVTARRALDGDDPTQLYIAAADPSSRPTLRARGLAASDAVERVLAKALHVEPTNRYGDAGEFWSDLVAAIQSGGPAVTVAGIGDAGSPDSHGGLTTAEYALQKRLDVHVEAHAATAEAVTSAAPSAGPRARIKGRAGDPMEETPLPDRRPVQAAANGALHEKPVDPAAANPGKGAPPGPPKRPGAGWPWVLALLAVAGGAVAYWLHMPPEGTLPVAPATPSASTPKTSPKTPPRSKATAAPQASAMPSAAPSASAPPSAATPEPPPPPPEGMMLVPPGKLRMGEGPAARDVEVSRAFYLDRSEVTVRDYLACVTQRLCSPADRVSVTPEGGAAEAEGKSPAPVEKFVEMWSTRCNAPRKAMDHPVNCVDFTSAEGFCRFRGRRLPTEAEWELAARGPEGRKYPWGKSEPDCESACYDRTESCGEPGKEATTCAPGTHAADRTPEGVVDLAGNVSEWVSDGFASQPKGGVDPHGDPSALLRVVRGGNFVDGAIGLSGLYRNAAAPVTAHVTIGFRCAMDAPRPAAQDGVEPPADQAR